MSVINEPGLIVDGPKIILNTDLWTTQAELAQKLGVTRNALNNRIARYTANGTLRTYYIKQLRTRLIPNVKNINDLGNK